MAQALRWWSEIGVIGVIDMALMALLLYGLLTWIRRTRRTGLILAGISILGGVYLLASYFRLLLTTAVLQAFFAIFLILLVVIFQEELRQLFEQIARWGLSGALLGRKTRERRLPRPEVDTLVDTLSELAAARIGALVVVAGQDSLARHVNGGVAVNGDLSGPLLSSIFDPHSAGHDGAVLIIGGRIESLGVRLPLTHDEEALGSRGTRHAAALGLSERTDALCLVVSEERGTVSVARRGELRVVSDEKRLAELIETHCSATVPRASRRPWRALLTEHYREKVAAVLVAALLWFVLAYRTRVIDQYFTVTVQSGPPPAGLSTVQLIPSAVEVRVGGARRQLDRLRPGDIQLDLPMEAMARGPQVIPISGSMFRLPEGCQLLDFRPRQVFVVAQENPSLPRNP